MFRQLFFLRADSAAVRRRHSGHMLPASEVGMVSAAESDEVCSIGFLEDDVVRRGPSAAGIMPMLGSSGIDHGDGKRPGQITVHPYSRGRCLIWDATCVNTFASSNLIRAALAAGSVADAAEVRKIAKYAEFGRRIMFQPVAVEMSGTLGKSTIQFFKDLVHLTGRAISGSTQERFPIPERVFDYSQRERLQHFAVVP